MREVDSTLLYDLVAHYSGPRGVRQYRNIYAIGPYMSSALSTYEINSFLRQAHFLAQICEESWGLSDMEEERSGSEYEGWVRHLGNTQVGDGIRFKGRGLIQVTGRKNYDTLAHELALDLMNHPELMTNPSIAVTSACQYWRDKDLNSFADNDDIYAITRIVNGKKMHGLAQRTMYLTKAKQLLIT